MDPVVLQRLLAGFSALIDEQAKIAECSPDDAFRMLNPQATAFVTIARLVRRQPALLFAPHSRLGFARPAPLCSYYTALIHWEREMSAKVALQML